jgi:hypothetical protein
MSFICHYAHKIQAESEMNSSGIVTESSKELHSVRLHTKTLLQNPPYIYLWHLQFSADSTNGLREQRTKASLTRSNSRHRPAQPLFHRQPSSINVRYHSSMEFFRGGFFINVVSYCLCTIVTDTISSLSESPF